MPTRPLRVLVAGGGVAAGEALLALRDLGGDAADVTLVTPDLRLPLRADATLAPFRDEDVATYDLGSLAAEAGAEVRVDRLVSVAPRVRQARLASGTTVEYDALLLAVGARARIGVPGATTFRDHRDAARLAALVEDAGDDGPRRLVFTVPAGVSWSLPIYELALQAARAGLDVTVVTPESEPLAVFGPGPAAAVAALVEEHDIELVTDRAPDHVEREGLRLTCGCRIAADEVVAVPALEGRRVTGIPTPSSGFVPTAGRGRVVGLDGVWAAGDVADGPVKQGGLAAQQADAAVHDILGIPPGDGDLPSPVLRAALLGGRRPLYLRTPLDADGRPGPDGTASGESPWWPSAKVVGRHLTAWLAAHPVQEAGRPA